MNEVELFGRLALAFAIGLMIGIERGWQSRAMETGTRALGVRTFALIGLLGGALGLVGHLTDDLVTALASLGFVAMIVVIYFTGLMKDQGRGATTEVAAILTFVLGIVAMRGEMEVAAASAVIVAATLGVKKPLHEWIKRIDEDEVTSALKLLVISVVVLPLLPNRGYGPGETINPYVLWWIVVVIAAISFAAHTAMRLFGQKAGAASVGLLGGLVSSTATTIAFARFAKTHEPMTRYAAGSIALACAVMFIRALILTGILFNEAVETLWLPMIVASATSLAIAALLSFSNPPKKDGGIELEAAADIGTGLKFVAAFVAVALATHYAQQAFGHHGALIASALGGLVDVDATNATMARLGASGGATVIEVTIAVLLAAAVNSVAKGVYAVAIAGKRFLPLAALVFLPPLATAGAAFLIERQLFP
ncbi:MAG: MgtC/SapB family protein [Rhodospirillaceae bacterium]